MILQPTRDTRTVIRFPYPTLCRARAPMTPVVKLVFGAHYDKTLLAEYVCVLGHAKAEGVARGGLAAYLDLYPGGPKGLDRDARERRQPADAAVHRKRAGPGKRVSGAVAIGVRRKIKNKNK